MGDGVAEGVFMRVLKVVALMAVGLVASSALVACSSSTSQTSSSSTSQTSSSSTSQTGTRTVAKGHDAITAGYEHTCAVLSGGTVQCWGNNSYGQLGDGTTTDSNVPVSVTGLTGVTAIAAGGSHTCALLSAAMVQCWGWNPGGQLGNGTTTDSNVPVSVTGITGVTAIAAGGTHTCALLSGGTVQCWGDNTYGQLGNENVQSGKETNTNSNVPVSVTGLIGVTAITAGLDHTCALLSAGTVHCWGWNADGELGNGTNAGPQTCGAFACSTVPVSVGGLTGVTAISAGYNLTCAVLSGGTAQCWGTNTDGQLGNGTNTDSNVPVSVTGLIGVTAISAGTTCALLSAGTVQCWGDNEYGQLGNGTNTGSNVPVSVTGLTGVTAISAGYAKHACALVSDKAIQCWGDNEYGQLGNGTNTKSNVPVSVSGL